MLARCRLARLGSPPPVITMIGKSDQAACLCNADARAWTWVSPRASSPMTAAAAPNGSWSTTSAAVRQTRQDTPASRRAAEMRSASRPLGARISTRQSLLLFASGVPFASVGSVMSGMCVVAIRPAAFANQDIGDAGQYSLEIKQRIANNNPMVEAKFANRAFMRAAALLDHRNCLPHLSVGFEETKQKHGIGQVTHVHWSLHLPPNQAVLRQNHETCDAFLVQEGSEFMQLHGQIFFAGHGVHESIQTI